MNGYTGGTASISSSGVQSPNQPEYTPFDSSGIVNAVLQSPQFKILEEEAKLKHEEVRAKKLANDELEDKQNAYKSTSSSYDHFVGSDGAKHFVSDPDFDQAWNDYYNAKGESPEIVVTPKHLSGDAYKARTILSDISTELSSNERSQKLYALQSKLYDLKLADPDVIYALSHMDSKQFTLLGKNIDKIDSEIDLAKASEELNKQQTRESKQRVINMKVDKLLTEANLDNIKNSNLGAMIDELFGAANFKDGFKSLLKILIVLAGGSLGSAVVGKLGNKAPVHNTYKTTNFIKK